jgi:hypothetical protein
MEVLSFMRAARRGEIGSPRSPRLRWRRGIVVGRIALLVIATACLMPAGRTGGARRAAGRARNRSAPRQAETSQPRGWRVTTGEQIDLWLHGFATLTSDTGRVPFFARGYKQQITAIKRQRNVYSLLDANQPELSARFATNPALANAQFLAMYFSSFPEIVSATDYFMRSGGNPRASADPNIQQQIALLAANFRTEADRKWLRLFVQSLEDESKKFYHDYWTSEQQARGAAFAQAVQQWNSAWYPKLSRFLNNTQQASGQVILSLPLGGEGRTVSNGKQSNIIAVEFPKTVDAAPDVLFAVAHEAVASVVDGVIRDNTTPAEQRSGATAGYVGNGAVRGGALLLQRVAPDLVPAYMRYYLGTAGLTSIAGDPATTFASTFPLPQQILDAIGREIDVVLGGI